MTAADPTVVLPDQLRAALAALGIGGPIEDIVRAEIGPERITVVRFRRDADGMLFLAGDEAAKITTTIGVDWSVE